MFGLMIQGGEVTAQKDEFLMNLLNSKDNPNAFASILFDPQNILSLFGERNDAFPPTEAILVSLQNAIKESPEIMGAVGCMYLRRQESKQYVDRVDLVAKNILGNTIVADLPGAAKDLLLEMLYENKDSPYGFGEALNHHRFYAWEEAFAPEYSSCQTTFDTSKLRDAVERNPELETKLAYFYCQHGESEPMLALLGHMLPQDRIAKLPITAKDARLNELLENVQHHYEFKRLLEQAINCCAFNKEYEQYEPTFDVGQLKDAIEMDRELYNIVFLFCCESFCSYCELRGILRYIVPDSIMAEVPRQR